MHENPPNRALLKSGQQDKEEKPNSSSSSLTVEQQFYGASIENSSSNNDTLIDSIVQSAHAYTVQSQPSALYSTRYNSNQNERRGSDSSSVSAGDTSLTPLTLPRDASNEVEVVHTGDVFNIIDETDKTIGNGVNPSVGTFVSSKSGSKQSPLHIYAFEKPLCSNSKFKDNYFVLAPTVATNNNTKSPPSSSPHMHANTSRSGTTNKRQSVAMYGKTKQKAVSPNSPISQQHVAKKIKMDRRDNEMPSTSAHLHQEHATSPLQNPSLDVNSLDFLKVNPPPEGTLPSGLPYVQQPTNTQLTESNSIIQDSTFDRDLLFTLPDRQQRMFDQNNHAQSSIRVGDQFLPQLPQVEDNSYLLILLNNYCEHLNARAVQNQQETTTQLISAAIQQHEHFPVPTYPQQSEQSPSVNMEGMMQEVLASAIGFEQQQCLSSISALLDSSIPQNMQIIPPIRPNVPNFNQQQLQQHVPQIFPTFPQPFESSEDSQQRELLKLLYQLQQSGDQPIQKR